MAAMMVACGILAALQARTHTGKGQKVEVDLLSTALAAQCQEAVVHLNNFPRWERSAAGITQPWIGAPYGIYPTSDGHLALAMNSLRVFSGNCWICQRSLLMKGIRKELLPIVMPSRGDWRNVY